MGLMRRIGAPVRGYFNNHFEMVKEEVRESSTTETTTALHEVRHNLWHLAMTMNHTFEEFAATSAESQQYVARQLAEMRQQTLMLAEVADRIARQLEKINAGTSLVDAHAPERVHSATASREG